MMKWMNLGQFQSLAKVVSVHHPHNSDCSKAKENHYRGNDQM